MAAYSYKYIYGPVSSWRLGRSIGIDLISQKNKVCSFDCIYCQLGRRKASLPARKIYVPTFKIIEELGKIPQVKIDYFTFSGQGEPALAKNLGEAIKAVKKTGKCPVAVITNASLINKKEVRKELAFADYVMLKLDAATAASFKRVNNPAKSINLAAIIAGLKEFRKTYKGIFALQVMFIKENKNQARKIAQVAVQINPDMVQINTPLRPCECNALSKKELRSVSALFSGLKVISVYDADTKKIKPLNSKDTFRRRGGLTRLRGIPRL